jgi:hypothetical protein
VSEFQRFMRDYSITALLFVVGILLVMTGIVMWGGLPALIIIVGILLILIGALAN